jgi:hypothetical protein
MRRQPPAAAAIAVRFHCEGSKATCETKAQTGSSASGVTRRSPAPPPPHLAARDHAPVHPCQNGELPPQRCGKVSLELLLLQGEDAEEEKEM